MIVLILRSMMRSVVLVEIMLLIMFVEEIKLFCVMVFIVVLIWFRML